MAGFRWNYRMVFVFSLDASLGIDVSANGVGRFCQKFRSTDFRFQIAGAFDFEMDFKVFHIAEGCKQAREILAEVFKLLLRPQGLQVENPEPRSCRRNWAVWPRNRLASSIARIKR